jgi:hypothetical protein
VIYSTIITIIKVAIDFIKTVFGKKPVDEERVRREFRRYDKAEDVQKAITKLGKKIEKVISKKCSRKAIYNRDYFNRCESKRQRLLRERAELIGKWERMAGTPYTQRGASPG